MRLALILTAIELAAIPQVWAQQPEIPEIRNISIAYGQCVVSYAKKYAKTRELPVDIATASFAWCFQERSALSKALANEYSKSGLPQPDHVDAAMEATERDIQRAAIRAIFEKRYPEIK